MDPRVHYNLWHHKADVQGAYLKNTSRYVALPLRICGRKSARTFYSNGQMILTFITPTARWYCK